MEKTGQGEQGPFMDCLTLARCSLSFPFLRTHLPGASHLGHLVTVVLSA